jgi:hypothetical protein
LLKISFQTVIRREMCLDFRRADFFAAERPFDFENQIGTAGFPIDERGSLDREAGDDD